MKKDFRRKKRKGGKLDPKWLGPYTIVDDLGRGFYSLSDGEKIVVPRVNGSHLKIFLSVVIIITALCLLTLFHNSY